MSSPDGLSERWRAWRARTDLDEYDTRWDRLAGSGQAVHGEAEAVARVGGRTVLDAGCGMGRVAVELARRGFEVTGIDNDPDMLERARRKPEDVRWELGDLATADLGTSYDVVVMAGSILAFVVPGSERAVVANMARHLAPGGSLLAGMPLGDPVTLADYDRWCAEAGLTLTDRWATWEGAPYDAGAYAVSIHRR